LSAVSFTLTAVNVESRYFKRRSGRFHTSTRNFPRLGSKMPKMYHHLRFIVPLGRLTYRKSDPG
jgi:hypothetical protein